MSYDREAYRTADSAQKCAASGLVEHVRSILGAPPPGLHKWRRERMAELLAEYDEHERTIRAALGMTP